jgi:filamentous hemagglutinin
MSKKTQRDMSYKEEVNSAELNAKDIVINAKNDVNLEASKLKAQDNIVVFAKDGDVNVLAKTYKEGELHQTSKSSFGGLKKSLDIKSSDALKLNSALLETQAANVVLTSGKDINILASEINSAADIQLKALNDVLIASQEEYLKTRSVNEKSSFNIAGLVGLVVPVGGSIYTQEIHKNDKVSSTNKQSSLTAKENLIVDSGTTNIIGSNLEANNISIKADTGEINILSSADIKNETSLDKKIELSLSNPIDMIKGQLEGLKDGNTKLKFEVGSLTYDEVDKVSQNTINNSSNLIAKENLVLDSLTDINIQGSNLKADENLVLNSTVGDINILNTTDISNEDIKEKHAKAALNLTVQNEYVETAQAVKAAVESAEQLKHTKDDYSNYKGEVKKLENTLINLKQSYKNKEIGVDYTDIEDLVDIIDNVKSQEKYYVAAIAAASADLASKTVAVVTQAEAASTSGATAGFSVGVSLDVNGNKSNTNTTSQISNASNLNAKNIYVNTDETLNTNINITGSNLIANDNLNVNTTNLNVKASQDISTSSQDSKTINGSISFTMYGGGGGTVGLGYGQQNSDSNTLINNNSILQGNNVNINASNDAIFQGVNVKANDTLNLNIGNNLALESLRDEYSSNSNGFNVNAGFGFGSSGAQQNRSPSLDVGKHSSTNAGFSVNNGTTINKQTVLSSIIGNKVNVNVGNNTHLKGALLASGNYDENGNFVDNKNLNFTTNTLSFENLSNSSYSSNQSLGGNFNYNLDSTKIVDKKEKPQQGGISSVGYNSENSLNVNASKTLATLGEGNITIKDIENSDEIERLNTDTTNLNKELYSSSTSTSVDATLDTRLLSVKGLNQIKEEYKDLDKNMKKIADTLPSAISDNKIEAVAGTIWDSVTAYGTFGLLPSNGNNGGVLGEIPILSGNRDSVKEQLQVVSQNAPLYQEDSDKFIPIEQSEAYKQMSDEKKAQVQGLYISKEPVIITKDNATYQNGGNGIMNDKGLSVFNVLEQTGMIEQYQNDKTNPVEATVFYNPSRGMVADSMETLVDLFGGTTGIAKQYGEFNVDVTTARGTNGSNFTQHSQNNILLKSGISYIKSSDNTGAKFMPQEYFISKTELGVDGKPKDGTPTYVSFGSPVNGKDLETLIGKDGLGYTFMGAYTKSGDFVGEGLGGNSGANGQASFIDRANLLNIIKLITPTSPHSSYKPTDYEELKDVTGYKK